MAELNATTIDGNLTVNSDYSVNTSKLKIQSDNSGSEFAELYFDKATNSIRVKFNS